MSAYLFLADGFEEVEAVTPIDFLRRAGIDLITVSVATGAELIGAHGITLRADCHISELDDDSPQALICPGGMPGAANLAASQVLVGLLRRAEKGNVYLCAICAAPALVFGREGADILGSHRFTCYPGFEARAGSGRHSPQRLVQDGNFITAIGAGAAAEFSLAIIEALKGHSAAEEIHRATLQKGEFNNI